MLPAELAFLSCRTVIKAVTDEATLIATIGSTGKVTHYVVYCLVGRVYTHVVRGLCKVNWNKGKYIMTRETIYEYVSILVKLSVGKVDSHFLRGILKSTIV